MADRKAEGGLGFKKLHEFNLAFVGKTTLEDFNQAKLADE